MICGKCGKDRISPNVCHCIPGYVIGIDLTKVDAIKLSAEQVKDLIDKSNGKFCTIPTTKRDTEFLLHETLDKYTALLFKYNELIDKQREVVAENYNLKCIADEKIMGESIAVAGYDVIIENLKKENKELKAKLNERISEFPEEVGEPEFTIRYWGKR